MAQNSWADRLAPAYQYAIDAVFMEGMGIFAGHTAAVEDPDPPGRLFAEFFRNSFPDQVRSSHGIPHFSALAAANGPNRFVGNQQMLDLPVGEHIQDRRQLAQDLVFGGAVFMFVRVFSHAQHRIQVVPESSQDLLHHQVIGFVEEFRRSLWPTSTYRDPISAIMGPDTAPV